MGSALENTWEGILQPGETVLWQDSPIAALSWEELNWPKGVMGLLFVGFSVFWMMLAAQGGGLFWMFGLIFLFIGLRQSLGQLLLDPWLRGQTVYSLTNKRAFIADRSLLAGRRLHSYLLKPDSRVELHRGRTDSLRFDAEQPFGRQGHRFDLRIGFENLADGRDAHRILTQITKGER